MEFKGTKGEWEVTGKRDLESYVVGCDRETICQTSFIAGANDTQKTRAEANAKLIASAPELLRALQTLIVAIESMDFQDGTLFKASHHKAVKAINKALL